MPEKFVKNRSVFDSRPLSLNLLQSILFLVSQGFLCNFNLRKEIAPNVERIAQFPGGEKSVESCRVSGCHVFVVRSRV